VKDSKRFKLDGWEYFAFSGNAQTTKAIGQPGGCNACHNKNAAVENTFVQFYPTLLEIARAKGTIKKTAVE
jgi:cytochrome c551/c552